ncbi:calcium binding mitochondrial carrier protein [Trichuris trichiura]|uniref:Calcium binding mitochondrial carrier protein n=1 Tax=Trichuris trichiura TaxID=36087 RepID=A0A077ZAH6_TRITR|nr:calcium binding mitochondrial carrier protein [Trichuris trichiura]
MPLPAGVKSYIPFGYKSVSDLVHQYWFEATPADASHLHEIFERYARDDVGNCTFMQPEVFVQHFLGLYNTSETDSAVVAVVARAADCDKDGRISFEDFSNYESILCRPDALYLTAFEMFNRSKTRPARISFEDFFDLISLTQSIQREPLNVQSNFIDRYFGKDRKNRLGYMEFCQLLHDFHHEQALEWFQRFDKAKKGAISAAHFCQIMINAKGHMLSEFVRSHLAEFFERHGIQSVTFPMFMAFNGLLDKLELVRRIYLAVAKGSLQKAVVEPEFLHAAKEYAQLTPLEVEILFNFAEVMHTGRREVTFNDLTRLHPFPPEKAAYSFPLATVKAVDKPSERSAFIVTAESLYRFGLGSLGGATGATAVYPIDLVKTRMQNQRTSLSFGEPMYTNSWNCFRMVLRHEGFFGLYRGLAPQLAGVMPEKAIKLTVNDFVRDKFTNAARIPFWAEVVAGGSGGASQVMFTNPVEIVKIRMQMAGEMQPDSFPSLVNVCRQLGFTGLYKGASACFLRDIPFSAIYFPLYAHAKLWFADADGHNDPWSLFSAAFIAGVPAAGICTPPDVVKTRLQVAKRTGTTHYSGLLDCCRKVWREEGFGAFWKGSTARILRSSPQFGVTLMVYELLQRMFYVDFAGTRPTGSKIRSSSNRNYTPTDHHPDHIGGYRLARATFAEVQSKFGLLLPTFKTGADVK